MNICFLTSDFRDGFTDEFTARIKHYYSGQGSFAFIGSDFDGHYYTDRYFNSIVDMFKLKGIEFLKADVIDSRLSEDEAIWLLKDAEIVWISGGDTLKQMDFIRNAGIIPTLQSRKGITIGMSAGSINMAKQVVLPKDEEDNIPELSIYSGIGLVDLNIEPHLDLERTDHLEDIDEATIHTTIYGLFDNSFIEVVNDNPVFYGPYVKYNKKF